MNRVIVLSALECQLFIFILYSTYDLRSQSLVSTPDLFKRNSKHLTRKKCMKHCNKKQASTCVHPSHIGHFINNRRVINVREYYIRNCALDTLLLFLMHVQITHNWNSWKYSAGTMQICRGYRNETGPFNKSFRRRENTHVLLQIIQGWLIIYYPLHSWRWWQLKMCYRSNHVSPDQISRSCWLFCIEWVFWKQWNLYRRLRV